MKKIVYIRGTEIYNDSRATKEIMTLASSGYEVLVLAWDRRGVAEEKCAEVFESFSSVLFRFYKNSTPSGIGIRHIDKLIGWVIWGRKEIKKVKNVDIIHACDLDSGLLAYPICRRRNIKLVYDIYDYYIDTHPIPKILERIIENYEIKIINSADLTIICTEERKQQIEKSSPKNLIVIHNSPDIPELNPVDSTYDSAYCGGLDEKRLVGKILRAYPENKDLKFEFAGFGACSNLAEEYNQKYPDFQYHGIVAYDKVIEIESKAICLSAIYDPSYRNHRLCAPNKLYEALALGKPVIVCKGTGIDRIVSENNIGVVIEYNADDFYNAVRYLKSHPDFCYLCGQKARRLYEEKYNWAIMRKRLLEAYNNIKN